MRKVIYLSLVFLALMCPVFVCPVSAQTNCGALSLLPFQVAPDGGFITKHIFSGSSRVATITSAGTKWYLPDHLGSTSVVADASGRAIEKDFYKPFGEFASSSSYMLMSGSHYFTGKEFDISTGLYYYGARYYNPALGWFIQPDPVVANIYDSQNFSPYSYCRNNPLRIVDPTGMLGEDWSMGVSWGSGGDLGGMGGFDFSSTTYTLSTTHTYSNIMGGVEYGYSTTNSYSWSTAPSYLTAMDFNLSSLTAPMYGAGMMAKPMAVGAVVAASIAWEPANIAYSAYNIATGKGTWADWVGLGAAAGAVKLVGALSEIASTTSRAMEDVSAMSRGAQQALNATADINTGMKLYRVYGDDAAAMGKYWTTINPQTISDYRKVAGLYPGNTGRFLIGGTLTDVAGVSHGTALHGPGGVGGGLREVIIPDPGSQIRIDNVWGLNPEF